MAGDVAAENLRDRRGLVLRELNLETGERMIGHIEPQHLAFECELVALGPLRTLWHMVNGFGLVPEAVKVKADLTIGLVAGTTGSNGRSLSAPPS